MNMVRRIWLVLMLLGVSAHAGAALAAPPGPAADDLRFTYYGTLDAVDAAAVSFTAADGAALTFKLGPDAKLTVPGNPTMAAADLAAGVRVRVTVERANPQADWEVVRLRVLERSAIPAARVVPVQPSIAAHVDAYSEGASVNVTRADGTQATYTLTAETRLLPAGRVAAPQAGDPVLLIFKPGAPAGAPVWGVVVLPKPNVQPTASE